MNILLDTCTFLWIVSDSDFLSNDAKIIFREPTNDVYLSSVSVWEISVKYILGKLPLPSPPNRFVPEQRVSHHVSSIDLTESDALHLHHLPSLHRDPFDRMLVCQAIENGLTILTPDEAITSYPVRSIW